MGLRKGSDRLGMFRYRQCIVLKLRPTEHRFSDLTATRSGCGWRPDGDRRRPHRARSPVDPAATGPRRPVAPWKAGSRRPRFRWPGGKFQPWRRQVTLSAMARTSDARAPRSTRGQLTIADIARLAGVSIPTVSKVVNGRLEVAAETRAHVEKVIHEHRYRRSRRGTSQATAIELVFHELAGIYPVEIMKGVERVA